MGIAAARSSAAVSHAPAKADQGGTRKPSAVALTPEEKTILATLANECPLTVTQEELAEQTRLSYRTVRKYLGDLRNRGFVNQPRGPKKGSCITPDGLAAIGRK